MGQRAPRIGDELAERLTVAISRRSRIRRTPTHPTEHPPKAHNPKVAGSNPPPLYRNPATARSRLGVPTRMVRVVVLLQPQRLPLKAAVHPAPPRTDTRPRVGVPNPPDRGGSATRQR